MLEQIHLSWLTDYEAVLNRRALQFEKLQEKDIFSMPQEEQVRHHNLLQKLAEELVVMDRMRWLATEYLQLQIQLEAHAKQSFNWARREYELLARETHFLREYCGNISQQEDFWIKLLIEKITEIKHLRANVKP